MITYAKLEDKTMQLSFPKSVAVTTNQQIIVCDTGNNRVIGFNSGGIQTFVFDKYDVEEKSFQLTVPLSVCIFAGLYIAVANYGSSVINILTELGVNESIFICKSKPISLSSDSLNILYVLTESQTIECYSIFGKRIATLQRSDDRNRFFSLITCNKDQNEIYLSGTNSSEIFVIDKKGCPLRNMALNITGSGLNLFISCIQYVKNRILIADSVNRCVVLFDCVNGEFEEMLLNGRSCLGSVQALCLSTENQLITTEYTINQPHNVKIFSCSYKLNYNKF